MQLELEHIDQTALNNISEERLKHYIKVLKEQLRELQQEIQHIQHGFTLQFNRAPFDAIAPSDVLHQLDRDIAEARATIREMESDLVGFSDIRTVKAFVKAMRQQRSEQMFDT